VALGETKGHLGTIGQQLIELEVEFQRQWARVKHRERKREDFVAWVRQTVRPDWERMLQAARDGPGSEPALVRWLLDDRYRSMAWTFLDYPGMEPTNNETERAVRGPVIQRKISWGSQSEQGLRMMERLWTVHETCRRQGRRLLDYLTEAISTSRTGQPPPLLVGD